MGSKRQGPGSQMDLPEKGHRQQTPATPPHIREEVIEQAFQLAMEELIHNQSDILAEYGGLLQTLSDTTSLDLEIARLKKEMNGCAQRFTPPRERAH